MQALQVIEIAAGTDPEGKTIVEQLRVRVREDDRCQLVHSPFFIQGLASGDTIDYKTDTREFELIRRSGNLAICVICRNGAASVGEHLTPELEKLGGELDTENERLLIYSIHVSCGFNDIEAILNKHVNSETNSVWRYNNVYDPKDGQTPLNWWLEFDNDT